MKTTVEVSAQLKSSTANQLVIEITVPLVQSMLYGEEIVQAAVNAVGLLATTSLLKSFDTDGSPIHYGGIRFTSKGLVEKEYETPYGKARLERHVYQPSAGGETFCPLDDAARIMRSATPKLAKMIANKYSRDSVDEVKADFRDNHGRSLSRGQIQEIADHVGAIAIAKESSWHYRPDISPAEVATVAIGLDGAMMLMRADGYRQAMSGSIALYDRDGARLHTDYIAAAPEYGKATFLKRMSDEITQIKEQFPDAHYVGIADGASDNWRFLEHHTTTQITDFYHATEYLTEASKAIFNQRQEKARIEWLEQHCHDLKHNKEAIRDQLQELETLQKEKKLSAANQEKLNGAITYFTHQGHRMNYADYRALNLPIGSGVTEAACKVTIKQRLCRSGMRWKDRGASIVLALRCLVQSNRWGQFWDKINQYGVPEIA
jgi:hypothetical protein